MQQSACELCVKTICHALDLTKKEFMAQYYVPLGTLRDYEQRRSEPDQPAQSVLYGYRPRSRSKPVGIAKNKILQR